MTNTAKYAVTGGNMEIVKLCKQNHSSFEGLCEIAAHFHRNKIFLSFINKDDNKIEVVEESQLSYFEEICITSSNYELFSILEGKGMKINQNMINEAVKIGNIFPFQVFS